MLSNGFAHRIELRRRFSIFPAAYLLALYCLVFATVFWSDFSPEVKLLGGIVMLWCARVDWESSLRTVEIAFLPPQRWRLRYSGEKWQVVQLHSYFAAWSWLTLLRFKLYGRRELSLALLECNPRAADRRRLMVWLRWADPVDSAGA